LLYINVPRNITITVVRAFELLQVDTLEMRAWRTSTSPCQLGTDRSSSRRCSADFWRLVLCASGLFEAILLPNGPGIHVFGVSVQLVGNHFPTTDESFQDRGLGIVLRRGQQPPDSAKLAQWLFPPRRLGVGQPKERKLRDRRDPERVSGSLTSPEQRPPSGTARRC
jgi:hypothetical protein